MRSYEKYDHWFGSEQYVGATPSPIFNKREGHVIGGDHARKEFDCRRSSSRQWRQMVGWTPRGIVFSQLLPYSTFVIFLVFLYRPDTGRRAGPRQNTAAT
jgi:hypothetical protein